MIVDNTADIQEKQEDGMRGDACVWLSKVATTPDLGFGFTCQTADEDNDALVAQITAFKAGEALVPADLPPAMWISPRFSRDDRRKLPHLFKAGGFLTVSEEFAQILRGFDLGRTQLHPVDLLRMNRQDQFPGKYYFLNIAEVHRYFSAEYSARYKGLPDSRTSYIAAVCIDAQDDDISVIPSALSAPAIWLDDTLIASLFFSDPLMRALRAAKLTNQQPIYRCKVATVH